MSWMGKILGGGIGFALGGPIGAVLGMVIGHTVDKSGLSEVETRQGIYFTATFSMLGKLAKADGVVSSDEIAVIERVMRDNLKLSTEARRFAIDIFNAAKDSEQAFEDFANQFYIEFGSSPEILTSLIELLLLIAHADGRLHESEEVMIGEAVRIFGLQDHYRQIKGRFEGVDNLDHAYARLDSSPNDELAVIKRRYRRLAMEYHPDRIQANGMSPEFAAVAEEKFKEIQHAWDVVEKHHQNA